VTDPAAPDTQKPLTTTQATLPTLGSILGSALGTIVAAKIAPGDALFGPAIISAVTGLFTGLFHLIGTKLGLATL
jgi:hypothetical protein